MLIPEKEKRLPVAKFSGETPGFRKQVPRTDFETLTGAQFADMAKGLVSYFAPNWSNIYADLQSANSVTEISLKPDQREKIKAKLNDTCKTDIASGDLVKIARCYLRRLHWFGKYLQPTKGDRGSTGFPGNLLSHCGQDGCISRDGKHIDEINVPRALKLVETIRECDLHDRPQKFKHVIYSSKLRYTADMYASALHMEYIQNRPGGFEFMTPKARCAELGFEIRAKTKKILNGNKEVTVKDGYDLVKVKGRGRKEATHKDVLFFMHDKMSVDEVDQMSAIFNDHTFNAHGEIARAIVLGAGRKEALSLHDVKYVHIMEPQVTPTDTTQIIGRARRYCSHTGLEMKDRIVKVFIYGLTFAKEDLNLLSGDQPNVILDEIAIDALQYDPKLSKELDARKKILSWLEISAYDKILTGKTAEQVRDAIQEAKRDLQIADAAAAAQRKSVHVAKFVPKSKQNIQYWKNECAAKVPPIPVKKSGLKKPDYEKCCGPNVTLANVDKALCLAAERHRRVSLGLPVPVLPGEQLPGQQSGQLFGKVARKWRICAQIVSKSKEFNSCQKLSRNHKSKRVAIPPCLHRVAFPQGEKLQNHLGVNHQRNNNLAVNPQRNNNLAVNPHLAVNPRLDCPQLRWLPLIKVWKGFALLERCVHNLCEICLRAKLNGMTLFANVKHTTFEKKKCVERVFFIL